jgi:hypothetical protein
LLDRAFADRRKKLLPGILNVNSYQSSFCFDHAIPTTRIEQHKAILPIRHSCHLFISSCVAATSCQLPTNPAFTAFEKFASMPAQIQIREDLTHELHKEHRFILIYIPSFSNRFGVS